VARKPRAASKPHPPRKLVGPHVTRLRELCLSYPEVLEAEQFGGPWWKAGKKSFCIYGADQGRSGAAFNLSLDQQADLVTDSRFSPTRYLGHHGWTSMVFERSVDWALVEELIDSAYRRVALKRMLKTLDAG
jgi:predicted DNA-binding protein (MmcQ/YjbR family)